jgi:hypothetical protein
MMIDGYRERKSSTATGVVYLNVAGTTAVNISNKTK